MARHYSNQVPRSPEELADLLADPERAAAMSGMNKSPAEWQVFKDRYAANLLADGSLSAQIREQTQMALGDMLKGTSGNPAPVSMAGPGRSARAALYNKSAPGVAVEDVFGSAAEVFQSVSWRNAHDPAAGRRLAKASEIQNSFGSEVPADGGFLVPETIRSGILEMGLESAIVRPRATVIPMSTLRVPIPMVDDTSHVSSVLGGVVYYWTEEGAALTESQASFGRAVLDAKKLTGFFQVPNELLADAPAFGGFFNTVIPRGLAWQEDLSFMTGTGAGEPLGFVNCPAAVSVSAEAGQPATTIVWENVVSMYSRMLPGSLGNAVWIANIDTFKQLATMALSVGVGGNATWVATMQQSGAAAPPLTLLGRPVYFTEKLPSLGTTGDLVFTDLSYYLLGDRATMQVSSSEHYAFNTDKTAFRIIERVDGRPWLAAPLTPHVSSSTLSAFVQLATR